MDDSGDIFGFISHLLAINGLSRMLIESPERVEAISSAMTFYAQRQSGAVSSLDSLPFAFRVGNASVSYINS
jgi:hypothetical protein